MSEADVVETDPEVEDEIVVEHVPVGEVVTARQEPYIDGDALVVCVYEEQVVVTKHLILREQLRIRRVSALAAQARARAETQSQVKQADREAEDADPDRETGGLVNLVRRALT